MSPSAGRRLGWLLSSSTLSNLGDGIAKVAFPLLAARLTHDPVLIGALSAAQFLPWLLFAVLTGGLLDRVDRKRAMLLANVARALVVGAVGAFVLFGLPGMWLVYVAALLIGTAETVADSAANVLVPSVTSRTNLAGANSKLQAAEIVGQTFLGGPVGSLTFAVFAAFPFLLNSAAFAVSAVLLLGLSGSYRPRERASGTERATTLRVELADGLRFLRGSPLLLRLVVVAGLAALLSELAQAQLVLYALDDLGLEEAAFGLFALVGGIGGLLGAAAATRLLRRFRRFPVLVGGLALAGLSFGGMGFSESAPASAAAFGLFAAAVVTVNVILATARHLLVPGELLGRVLGVWRTAVWGSIPVGALAGGMVTDVLDSPSATFALSGASLVALAVAASWLLRGYRSDLETTGEA